MVEGEIPKGGEDLEIRAFFGLGKESFSAFQFNELKGVPDPEQTRVLCLSEADRGECDGEHLAVSRIVGRDHPDLWEAGGGNIDGSDALIHGADDPR